MRDFPAKPHQPADFLAVCELHIITAKGESTSRFEGLRHSTITNARNTLDSMTDHFALALRGDWFILSLSIDGVMDEQTGCDQDGYYCKRAEQNYRRVVNYRCLHCTGRIHFDEVYHDWFHMKVEHSPDDLFCGGDDTADLAMPSTLFIQPSLELV